MNTIETTNLTKQFGAQYAVDHISFTVHAGEIFGFLGANGAGKTTAMRMLCGLLLPTHGNGRVAGFDIIRDARHIRSRIGYMSQKFSLYTDLTVMDNMKLFGALYGVSPKTIMTRISAMVDFLDLHRILSAKTATMPWGWQQRLSLACANLHQPSVLFLDEPTGSVDPVSRRTFWDFIKVLAEHGTTIFITTHHMDEAEYCDRISIMIDGRIAAIDTPAALKKQFHADQIQQVFITLVEQSCKQSHYSVSAAEAPSDHAAHQE